MKSYRSEGTARRAMKEGDSILRAKDGGIFIHRVNTGRSTGKYSLIGPSEERRFGNKENPRWKGLVAEESVQNPAMPKVTADFRQYTDDDNRG